MMPSIFLRTVILLTLILNVEAAYSQKAPPTGNKILGGVEVTKSYFLNYIPTFDSSMIIKNQTDVNGLPYSFGKDNIGGSIDLIGKEDEIVFARWTYTFNNDANNFNGLTNLGYFAHYMGSKVCTDWLLEKIKVLAQNHNKSFVEKKEFDFNRSGELAFDATIKKFMLTFRPRKVISGL